MGNLLSNLWIAWLFFIIAPLSIYLNYRGLKRSGFSGTSLIVKLLNPFAYYRLYIHGDKRTEKRLVYLLITATVVWFVFPFFLKI